MGSTVHVLPESFLAAKKKFYPKVKAMYIFIFSHKKLLTVYNIPYIMLESHTTNSLFKPYLIQLAIYIYYPYSSNT